MQLSSPRAIWVAVHLEASFAMAKIPPPRAMSQANQVEHEKDHRPKHLKNWPPWSCSRANQKEVWFGLCEFTFDASSVSKTAQQSYSLVPNGDDEAFGANMTKRDFSAKGAVMLPSSILYYDMSYGEPMSHKNTIKTQEDIRPPS